MHVNLFYIAMVTYMVNLTPDCITAEQNALQEKIILHVNSNTRRWPNAELMLANRLRHWSNIGSTSRVCWNRYKFLSGRQAEPLCIYLIFLFLSQSLPFLIQMSTLSKCLDITPSQPLATLEENQSSVTFTILLAVPLLCQGKHIVTAWSPSKQLL